MRDTKKVEDSKKRAAKLAALRCGDEDADESICIFAPDA
jgi:hypothetical protein